MFSRVHVFSSETSCFNTTGKYFLIRPKWRKCSLNEWSKKSWYRLRQHFRGRRRLEMKSSFDFRTSLFFESFDDTASIFLSFISYTRFSFWQDFPLWVKFWGVFDGGIASYPSNPKRHFFIPAKINIILSNVSVYATSGLMWKIMWNIHARTHTHISRVHGIILIQPISTKLGRFLIESLAQWICLIQALRIDNFCLVRSSFTFATSPCVTALPCCDLMQCSLMINDCDNRTKKLLTVRLAHTMSRGRRYKAFTADFRKLNPRLSHDKKILDQ